GTGGGHPCGRRRAADLGAFGDGGAVRDVEDEPAVGHLDPDVDRGARCVPDRVAEGLLDGAVGGQADGGRDDRGGVRIIGLVVVVPAGGELLPAGDEVVRL